MSVCREVGDVETDADFRVRIINAYGMWGAFCTLVMESSGDALDEYGAHLGLRRLTRAWTRRERARLAARDPRR